MGTYIATFPTDGNGIAGEGVFDQVSQTIVLKQGYGTVTTGTNATSQALAVGAIDGNLATIGAQADAAWSGSGSGSVVAILKAMSPAAAGIVGPATSQPTTTNAGSDTSWAFTAQVKHVFIQNNTPGNVQFSLDASTSAGSPLIAPDVTFTADIKVTTVHLRTSSARNINGTSAGNIIIWGWN